MKLGTVLVGDTPAQARKSKRQLARVSRRLRFMEATEAAFLLLDDSGMWQSIHYGDTITLYDTGKGVYAWRNET